MTSREYLYQVKRLHDLIQEEEADLKEDTEPEEPELAADGKDAYQMRLNYLDQLCQKHKEYYPKLKERMKRKINLLKIPREREVLVLRYIDLLDWDKVRKKMYCTNDAVFGIHKRALKHLQQFID